MAERATNRRVMTALRSARLDPHRVENACEAGTPDINFAWGWIEDKHLRRWPRSGVVQLPHFTPQQRVWLTNRKRAGGGSWLLLQVGREYLLFDGAVAAEVVGRADEKTLRERAIRVWSKGLVDTEFVECLRDSKP